MQPKEERNALIIKLWNEGRSNQRILTVLQKTGYQDLKNAHSLSGVISRLQRSGKLPRERKQQTDKAISKQITKSQSKQINKSTSQQVYKRATYYLAPEMIKYVKILAIKRDVDASTLVRDILTKYLSRQGDL